MGAAPGAARARWDDIQQAKMTEEIGLAQPVEYTEAERRTIATHEAGHATVAWLVGKGRKLEVLSIVKRKDALGLLSHSEEEERFTKTRSEIEALIEIAFGGMVAEELFFGETSSGVASTSRPPRSPRARWWGASAWASTLVSSAAMDCPATSSRRSPPSTPGAKRSSGSCASPRTRSARCSRSTAPWSRRCATRCSSATS